MARQVTRFTQASIVRAVKAVRAAGEPVRAVEIDRDGKLVVLVGEPTPAAPAVSPFDEWKAKRDARST